MHVLISAVSRFTSPTGICRHAANLASCLSQADEIQRITFVTGAWQQEYFRNSLGVHDSKKLRFVPVPVPNNSASRNAWFLRDLPAFAAEAGCDIAHFSFPVPVRKRSFHCKTIVSLHDLYPYDCAEVFGFPNVLFNRYFLRLCLRNCDAIAAVSNTTRKRAQELFPQTVPKLHVAPNIVTSPRLTPSRPRALRFSNFLLTVGQHRANKNLPLAVRSFRLMIDKSVLPEDSGLVIVGSRGPETAGIKSAISGCGLQDRVQMLESLPDEELQWLYQHCALFIVTSTAEGFCLPLVEAISSECKIICSDIPILREIGSSRCHYFRLVPDPCQEILEAAIKASSRVHESAAHDCLQRFAPSVVRERYLEIYRGLLAGTSNAGQGPARAVLVP